MMSVYIYRCIPERRIVVAEVGVQLQCSINDRTSQAGGCGFSAAGYGQYLAKSSQAVGNGTRV